jgi:PKD repeat protein
MKAILMSVLIISGTLAFSQNNNGFQFLESSAGLETPTWETGMTEVEFADINKDGFVDILSVGDHGCPGINATEQGIMVWFGDGTGTWSVQMTGDLGYGGISVGDVNNDGHWDVGYGIHHNYSSTDLGDQLIEVALGDGTGTSWTPWDDGLATNGESWGMFGTDFADADNDGDLDLGSNSFGSGSGLHVYLNQGDGTWIQSFGIIPGNSNDRFVFGDINNDGNVDFVVTHDAGIAFFGDGTGSFTLSDFNLPHYSFPMTGPALGDVNYDGGKDLAYVNPSGGIMVWAFDPGSSQWTDISGTLPASGDYQEVQLCDFDLDGTLDLAAFGNGILTVWSGALTKDRAVLWTQEFTTTTSNNGDCAAFRAGGDVDRNGYPDLALVEDIGNWPNDKNHLQCFRETTPYSKPGINTVFPRGKEVFKQGSVQFIDWITAVPSSSTSQVKIEYSLQGLSGPWNIETNGTVNSGRYQWIVPLTVSSNNCYIRYTMIEGTDTVVATTSAAFTILGSNGLVADFYADSTLVTVGSQIHFYDRSIGLVTSWQWDFDNNGTIDATERNPAHSYLTPGTYTVRLMVTAGMSSQTEIKTDYITVLPPMDTQDNKMQDDLFTLRTNPSCAGLLCKYNGTGILSAVVELYDLAGKLSGNWIITASEGKTFCLDLNPWSTPGEFFIYRIMKTDGELISSGKIILR